MSNKIGRFEIQSQIAQSSIATVYKALDTENQQTVALKALQLDQVKDREDLIKVVFDEAEQSKLLSSHNIATLYGVGDEEGLLLAAAEYVQGNSIATTLARKEGFSIWDLQDIARQICHALDHAHSHRVVHQSLEPAKVMVQWDGVVKLLGFGISAMNAQASGASASAPEVLHYSSPEQLRGESTDHRSSLFSLGAILYEMATEQKAFGGETPDHVRDAILEQTPPLPHRLKANVNPGLSALIMKALSKSPDERYQSGQELVRDLEQCKPGANTPAAKAQIPQKAVAEQAKAQTAAAGGDNATQSGPGVKQTPLPSSISGAGPVSGTSPQVSKSAPPSQMSASAAEGPAKPHFAVDPMMAEDDDSPAAVVRKKFSDLNELPPLEAAYVAPPASSSEAEVPEPLPQVVLRTSAAEKSKVQVREVAQKAVTEIRKTPPKLYVYALGGAVVVIALIVSYMALHNYMEDRAQGVASTAVPPAAEIQPAPNNSQPAPQPTESQPSAPESQIAPPDDSSSTVAPPDSIPSHAARGKKSKSHAFATPGSPAQLAVNSNPAGAQITFDGSALCLSPCNLTGIPPGQHIIGASKPGYGSESRTLTLASGTSGTLAIDLPQIAAKLIVASAPAGAVIVVDGKDTGKLTPSQLLLDKPGTHTVVLRRSGYLEETSSAIAEAGQTANVNLLLKPLGSTDEIRAAGGKFKKVFGGGDTANMGIVSVKTLPKGAQIMVNNRVLDKTAPFEFYLNPGVYVLDINMAGYRGIHRVVNVEAKERVAIEESLLPE